MTDITNTSPDGWIVPDSPEGLLDVWGDDILSATTELAEPDLSDKQRAKRSAVLGEIRVAWGTVAVYVNDLASKYSTRKVLRLRAERLTFQADEAENRGELPKLERKVLRRRADAAQSAFEQFEAMLKGGIRCTVSDEVEVEDDEPTGDVTILGTIPSVGNDGFLSSAPFSLDWFDRLVQGGPVANDN